MARFVVDQLGCDGAVLLLDETGDVKKGTHTVGVQRQDSGTAGRIENSQVVVAAAWATPRGAAFIDRELYVLVSWIDDPGRCAAAGLSDGLQSATKPALALLLVEHSLAAGRHAGWVAAEEVYGRRSPTTGETAFYRCWAPTSVGLNVLIRTAGVRWKIEEAFPTGKGLAGLDEHQVRRYVSWCRWTVLVMLAHADLTVLAAEQPEPPDQVNLIPLTRNEITHLLAVMHNQPQPTEHRLHWSTWRRCHQHTAQRCHYQRRQATPL